MHPNAARGKGAASEPVLAMRKAPPLAKRVDGAYHPGLSPVMPEGLPAKFRMRLGYLPDDPTIGLKL